MNNPNIDSVLNSAQYKRPCRPRALSGVEREVMTIVLSLAPERAIRASALADKINEGVHAFPTEPDYGLKIAFQLYLDGYLCRLISDTAGAVYWADAAQRRVLATFTAEVVQGGDFDMPTLTCNERLVLGDTLGRVRPVTAVAVSYKLFKDTHSARTYYMGTVQAWEILLELRRMKLVTGVEQPAPYGKFWLSPQQRETASMLLGEKGPRKARVPYVAPYEDQLGPVERAILRGALGAREVWGLSFTCSEVRTVLGDQGLLPLIGDVPSDAPSIVYFMLKRLASVGALTSESSRLFNFTPLQLRQARRALQLTVPTEIAQDVEFGDVRVGRVVEID